MSLVSNLDIPLAFDDARDLWSKEPLRRCRIAFFARRRQQVLLTAHNGEPGMSAGKVDPGDMVMLLLFFLAPL